MSLDQLKFSNLNTQRKETQRKVSNAISQLNAAADEAMKQQAYMHSNPDDNGANELIAVATPDFNASAQAFNEVAQKLQDMQLVQAGTLSITDYIAKYNIDLSEFSERLI
ncbi:hypothetical protein NO989_04275 [Alteromonas sp. DY56-G5]|uniref:hypothetical protein n=1 Tax=Alteromonas sp. DY56-G5 TaxID=2967128 RepID=UPI003529D4B0